MENKIDVEIPPKRRPAKSHQKFGDTLTMQHKVYKIVKMRHRRFLPKRSARGPVIVPNKTEAPNPTMYSKAMSAGAYPYEAKN